MTEPLNREQRRAAERGKHESAEEATEAEQAEQELIDASTPADVTSVRAKSSRHGKSTADKWNQ